MKKKYFCIENKGIKIPAVLWGFPRRKILIEVHGNMSHKDDTVITMMALKAVRLGYQALCFDLPMQGERKNQDYLLNPQNCISDLLSVYEYARTLAPEVYLFACSTGAYFSLLAYREAEIKKALFLSPVVNMEHLMQEMMSLCGINEETLQVERHIELQNGAALDWDYFDFLRKYPINFSMNIPLSILYGSYDNLVSLKEITDFASRTNAKVDILKQGGHFFHTENELRVFDSWAEKNLI